MQKQAFEEVILSKLQEVLGTLREFKENFVKIDKRFDSIEGQVDFLSQQVYQNTLELQNCVKKEDIVDMVRQSDIADMVRKEDIADMVRNKDIIDVVRQEDIERMLTKDDVDQWDDLYVQADKMVGEMKKANEEGSIVREGIRRNTKKIEELEQEQKAIKTFMQMHS